MINGRNRPTQRVILVFDEVVGSGNTYTSDEYYVGDYTYACLTSYAENALVAYTELQMFIPGTEEWLPLWVEILANDVPGIDDNPNYVASLQYSTESGFIYAGKLLPAGVSKIRVYSSILQGTPLSVWLSLK